MGRRQAGPAVPQVALVREFWGSLTDTPRHHKATQRHSITKIDLHTAVILATTFSPTARGALFGSRIERSEQAVLAGATPSSAPSPGSHRRSLYSKPLANFPQDRFITFGADLLKQHHVKTKQFISPWPLLRTPVELCVDSVTSAAHSRLGFPGRITWTC